MIVGSADRGSWFRRHPVWAMPTSTLRLQALGLAMMSSDFASAQPARPSRLRSRVHQFGRGALALVAAWVMAAAVLIAAGEAVAHSTTITSWDEHITRHVVAHRTSALTAVMKGVTWAGSWIAAFVMACLIAVLAWRRRMRPVAVVVVITLWLGELAAVTLTKSVVRRPRPPEAIRLVSAHGWSFPSGHTANAVVVFVTFALLVTALVGAPWVRVLSWVVSMLALGLVGFSRIELGVHWTTDVLASWVWCAGWILLAGAILRHAVAPGDPFQPVDPPADS
jgi:undecaprenyl-diphosphatase